MFRKTEWSQTRWDGARNGLAGRECSPARLGDSDVIQVVSRAFDVLRCFEGHEARVGNLEISNRCGLPRSTVSRLTHTLTRMGHLVYLPRDQKYRIGPSAVAMSTSMMKGLQLRNLIRLRLQDVADQLPGTVGFVIPDRFHLRSIWSSPAPRMRSAKKLHEATGSRISMATTAAGHAYTAALDPAVGDALIAEMEGELPDGRQDADAAHRSQSPASAGARLRRRLRPVEPAHQRRRGAAVVAAIPDLCGRARSACCRRCMTRRGCIARWRRRWSISPPLGSLLEGADGDIFGNRIERKSCGDRRTTTTKSSRRRQ